MERFDKSLVAVRKVIATGMKLIVRIEKDQVEIKSSLKELSENQKKTGDKLDSLLGISLRRRNGHGSPS